MATYNSALRRILDSYAEEARHAKRIMRIATAIALFLAIGIPALLLTGCGGPTEEEITAKDRGWEILQDVGLFGIIVGVNEVGDEYLYLVTKVGNRDPEHLTPPWAAHLDVAEHRMGPEFLFRSTNLRSIRDGFHPGDPKWCQIMTDMDIEWPSGTCPTEAPNKEDEVGSESRLSDAELDDRITTYADIQVAPGSLPSNPNWMRLLGTSPLDEFCDPFYDDGSNCAIAAH